MSDLNFRKHSTITQMIYDSPTILCLVPTAPGVVVPASVIVGNSLTLQIGHGLTPPIHDLTFAPEYFVHSGVLGPNVSLHDSVVGDICR